jgi:hypothetical protein
MESLEERRMLTTVDTLSDTTDPLDGHTTLREAITATLNGGTVNFDPAVGGMNGGVITLREGQIGFAKSLIIDASMLSNGITIDASGNDSTPRTGHDDTSFDGQGSRIFEITDPSGGTDPPLVTLKHLTLTGGDA